MNEWTRIWLTNLHQWYFGIWISKSYFTVQQFSSHFYQQLVKTEHKYNRVKTVIFFIQFPLSSNQSANLCVRSVRFQGSVPSAHCPCFKCYSSVVVCSVFIYDSGLRSYTFALLAACRLKDCVSVLRCAVCVFVICVYFVVKQKFWIYFCSRCAQNSVSWCGEPVH